MEVAARQDQAVHCRPVQPEQGEGGSRGPRDCGRRTVLLEIFETCCFDHIFPSSLHNNHNLKGNYISAIISVFNDI